MGILYIRNVARVEKRLSEICHQQERSGKSNDCKIETGSQDFVRNECTTMKHALA
jgi:hypothetical protein